MHSYIILHISFCRLYSGFLIFQSPLQKIADSFFHRCLTQGNQKRMDQIQGSLEEMWAQMDARMAQFMEAILTVTRNQEELRVLVETPCGHHPFEYGDVLVGQPRPILADFEELNLDGNHANGHGNAGRNQGRHGGPVSNQGFISRNQGNPNFNLVHHRYVPPPPPPSYHGPQVIPREMYDRYQGSEVDHNDDRFSVHNSEISVLVGDMRYQRLEEYLKAIEGQGLLGMDMMDLGLVLGVRIPPKFKVPVFDKYTRATCPKTHVVAP